MNKIFLSKGLLLFLFFYVFMGISYLIYGIITSICGIFVGEIELKQNNTFLLIRIIPGAIFFIYGIIISKKAIKEIVNNKCSILGALFLAIKHTWPFSKKESK